MSEEGRGGNHASPWIVTYCDMITLMIACFIMIITFSSRDKGNLGGRKDAIIKGAGGSGVAGSERKNDRDALVWRILPSPAHITNFGSEMPPLHSDPSSDPMPDVLRKLEANQAHTLADSYQFQIPLRILFDPKGVLTASGAERLSAIARNVRALPYDLLFQVDDPQNLSKAIRIAQYLGQKEAIHPGRIGVGLRESAEPWKASVWLTFSRTRGEG